MTHRHRHVPAVSLLFLSWVMITVASIAAPLLTATVVEARRDVTTARMAVGFGHGCAVTPAGGVECWGDNQYGELGVSGVTHSATPVAAQLPVDWRAVAVEVGEHHTCALLADGGVGCWGLDLGQLGAGAGDQAPGPVRVQLPTHRSAIAISANSLGTCAILDDGTVVCWGWQNNGELGQATHGMHETPQSVPMPGGEAAVAISISLTHGCAVLDTGRVTCWGSNTNGQFGDGTTAPSTITGSASTPVLLDGGRRAVEVAAGQDFTCALSEVGVVNCWGRNVDGRLGDGTLIGRQTPTPIALGPTLRVVQVRVGALHGCALVATGAVYCWGDNTAEQVGDGTTQQQESPVLATVVSGSPVMSLEAGFATSCALLQDDTLQCWGRDTPATPHTFPTGTRVVQVAGGGNHTCALNSEGLVWCWGQNLAGQLGRGTVSLRELQPAGPVTLPSPGRARAITAGTNHTCALLVDGRVSCWGQNSAGQLGVGVPGDRSTPSDPIALQGSGRARAISAGGSHTCALHTDGTIACWGSNQYGQLGDGGNTNRFATHDVVWMPGGSTAIDVTTGLDHTCALKADGAMACWGRNGDGQLGDTTTNDRTSAVTVSVPPGTRAVAIDAGGFHTCALFGAGTVTCWGDNRWGQLGTDPAGAPVRSPSGTLSLPGGHPTQASELSVGDSHTCVLLDDGTAACWGYNGNGELGDGTQTTRFSPATTSSQPYGARLRTLSAGFTHHCAVLDDGSMSCWGQNFNGQLGTGDRIDLLNPDRGGRRTMPTALTATTASATAVLTWREPTSPYGPQTWEVEGSTDGTTWWPATVSVTSPLGTTVSGLTNGVSYRFRVTATTPLDSTTITLGVAVTPHAPPAPASTPTISAATTAPTARWPFAPAESITGDDPADVAAALSRRRFAAGSAPTVHVVRASRTVDAAAAGAAAVTLNGPVLLVHDDLVPSATATEIRRLGSRRVVVVGGDDAIGDGVVEALEAWDGVTVTRVWGADRAATAATVSRVTYRAGVDTVYVVAGDSTTDGLGAARFGQPVLLTNRVSLPAVTRDELRRLRPDRVVVIGGTSVVSPQVLDQIEVVVDGDVVRWAGNDRFATTALVAAAERPAPSSAVVVDGRNPSAGVAVATLLGDPQSALVLARPSCLPLATRAVLDRWSPTTVLTVGITPDLTRTC